MMNYNSGGCFLITVGGGAFSFTAQDLIRRLSLRLAGCGGDIVDTSKNHVHDDILELPHAVRIPVHIILLEGMYLLTIYNAASAANCCLMLQMNIRVSVDEQVFCTSVTPAHFTDLLSLLFTNQAHLVWRKRLYASAGVFCRAIDQPSHIAGVGYFCAAAQVAPLCPDFSFVGSCFSQRKTPKRPCKTEHAFIPFDLTTATVQNKYEGRICRYLATSRILSVAR